MGSGESLPLGVDVAALLLDGETISSPAATLTDVSGAASGGTVGGSSVAGTVITQAVSALAAGNTYRLVVAFTAGGKTWQTETLVRCVF